MWRNISHTNAIARRPGSVLFLVLLLGVVACIHVTLSSRQSLWVDEVFSIAIACGKSLEQKGGDPSKGDFVPVSAPEPARFFQEFVEPGYGNIRTITRATFLSDTNPPVYYLLLNAWMRLFGGSDVAVRLLSAFFALASLPFLFSLARVAGGTTAAMMAGVLFLFSPTSVYYATEARMYSLLWLETTCLLWFSLRLLQQPRPLFIVGWLLVSCAGFWSHYFFLFVWIPAAGLLLLQARPTERNSVLIAVLSASLSLPFLLLFAHKQMQNWRITQDWLNGFPGTREVVLAPLKRIWFYLGPVGDWGGPTGWKIPAALAILLLFAGLLHTFHFRKSSLSTSKQKLLLWCALMTFSVVLAPSILDSLLNKRISAVPRYALAALPLTILFVAILLASINPRVQIACMVLFLSSSLLGISGLLSHNARHEQPFQQIAQHVSNWAKEGDLFIVDSIPSGILAAARYSKPDLLMAGWTPTVQTGGISENINELTYRARRIALLKIHSFAKSDIEAPLTARTHTIGEVTRHSYRLVFLDTAADSK